MRCASPASSHVPSVVMPTGTTSYLEGSSARATATAVTRETSCSADWPPNRTMTRRRCATAKRYQRLCGDLEDGANTQAHDEEAAEAVREFQPAAGAPHVAVRVQQPDADERDEPVE